MDQDRSAVVLPQTDRCPNGPVPATIAGNGTGGELWR